jgi:Putative prokaryotic signal transducing protein
MSIIRLTTCFDSFEANLIKGKLQDEGIICFLTNENFTTLFPIYNGLLGSGIQVMIDEIDLEKSLEIIKYNQTSVEVRCPNCNSNQITFSIGHKPITRILTIILSLLIWIPFGNIKKTYYCKNCKTKFKI